MAFAIDTYTGNGSTTTFSVTFPYIEKAHVIVTVDGVTKTLTTDYTFPTSSTITFNSAPSANAVIKFTRSSNRTARLVDYQDGSTLTEATLDQDGNQSFFMAQEAIDTTENTIGLTGSDEWDANNKKIINVTDPTTNQGAATKNYVDTKLAADINTVNSYKTSAETAATNAATSETNASNSATAAQTAQTAAETALDLFDDRFLGVKASDPTLDNDNNALVDGALYFSSADNIMRVYDLGTTSWLQLTLTSAQQTKVDTVVANITAIQNASANANTATTKASEASTSASNAATSETNAANSATSAANSATAAAQSASSVNVTTGLVIAMAIAL